MSDVPSPTGDGPRPVAIHEAAAVHEAGGQRAPDAADVLLDAHALASTDLVSVGDVVVYASDASGRVDTERWATLAAYAVQHLGERGELQLTFVDTAEITDLNREYMGVDGPTDVLSFPLDAVDEAPFDGPDGPPRLLGDIVLCPEVAANAAPNHAGTVTDELALLVVHGVLHLLGYDHAAASETELMRAREAELLRAYHWEGPAPTGFRHDHVDADSKGPS